MTRLVLGGYGPALGLVDLGPEGFGPPVEVAPAANPSFVIASPDGRFVYAALEGDEGRVGAWAVTDDAPWPALGRAVDRRRRARATWRSARTAAGWSRRTTRPVRSASTRFGRRIARGENGSRAALAVRPARRPTGRTARTPTRWCSSTAGCWSVTSGWTPSSGTTSTTAGSPRWRGRRCRPARGRRHLVVDGPVAYVLGELASTVTVCDVAGLVLTPGESVSLRRAGRHGREHRGRGRRSSATRSSASNRGDDTVAVLTRDGPVLRSRTRCRAAGRGHAGWVVDGDAVLVANERSEGLVQLAAATVRRWTAADRRSPGRADLRRRLPAEVRSPPARAGYERLGRGTGSRCAGPTSFAVFGIAWSQVRWQEPPMTTRSPCPSGSRSRGGAAVARPQHQRPRAAHREDRHHGVLARRPADAVAVPGDAVAPVAVEAQPGGDEALAELGLVVVAQRLADGHEHRVRERLVGVVELREARHVDDVVVHLPPFRPPRHLVVEHVEQRVPAGQPRRAAGPPRRRRPSSVRVRPAARAWRVGPSSRSSSDPCIANDITPV